MIVEFKCKFGVVAKEYGSFCVKNWFYFPI